MGCQSSIFARAPPKSSNSHVRFLLVRYPPTKKFPSAVRHHTTEEKKSSLSWRIVSGVQNHLPQHTRLPYRNFDDNNRLDLNDRLSLKKKREAPNKKQTPRLHCEPITSKSRESTHRASQYRSLFPHRQPPRQAQTKEVQSCPLYLTHREQKFPQLSIPQSHTLSVAQAKNHQRNDNLYILCLYLALEIPPH